MVNIKLLFIILDYGYSKKVNSILNKYGIKFKTISNASGTASPSLLSYFGLIDTKKEIYTAIIPDYITNDILNKINIEFDLKNIGTGIAFTIPITSSNKYLSDDFNKKSDRGEIMEKDSKKYSLIMTIVSEGHLEDVMTAAKKAGGSGGTSIKGRGLAFLKKSKVLGFNIEPEKDIVLNIVDKDNRTKVMEEITKNVGIKTEGKGICLSLPIEEFIGLNLSE